MKIVEDLFLKHTLQIDQEIAAAYEVNPAKRRVFENIVIRENDHFPDCRGNLILLALSLEVSAEPFRAGVGSDALRIEPVGGVFDRLLVNIGCEDLYIRLNAVAFTVLGNQYCKAVCLLSR